MKTNSLLSGVAVLAILLAANPAGAVSLNVGGDGGAVSVDADSGDSGGVGVDVGGDGGGVGTVGDKPLLGTGGDDLVTLDTDDDDDAVVTLFGGANDDVVEAEVLEPGTDEDVYLRLFGAGGGDSTATADLGDGDGGTSAEVTLFGGGDGTGGDGSGGGTGGSGGTDGTTTGSIGGGATTQAGAAARSQVGAGANCFKPDQGQINHLLSRNDYRPGDAEAWQQAASVNVVPVELCPEAEAQLQAAIAADDTMRLLQSAVASDARLSAEVNPRDVLAVDQSGQNLTVYVL